MGEAIPSFEWMGWTLPTVGGISVTQLEMLHERVGGVEDKLDKLTEEVHQQRVTATSITHFILKIEEYHKENKALLETLSDNIKFWRKFRQLSYAASTLAGAYYVGVLDFLRSHLK